MIKRLTIALGLVLAACTVSYAQVQNYAVRLDANSSVDCGYMPQLEGLKTYTFQFWLNPDEWNQGAVLFEHGTNFKVVLGAPGQIDFIIGNEQLTAASDELKVGNWAQVMLRSSGSSTRVYVDGEQVDRNTTSVALVDDAPFIIGGSGYKGRIDEVRIWKCLLSEEFEYYTFNTLNEWMPQYEDLLVYYKMDQELCEHLVDYCGIDKDADYNNHGILKGGATKEAVTDNKKMPYLINSAYTANERFFDRYIPAEQYRLSNDIINLGCQAQKDGHVLISTTNDHATLKGDAKQMSDFEGRQGVLSVGGNGWLEAPAPALNRSDAYGFEAFIYIEDWKDGDYILRRENADGTQGLAIMLDHFTSNRVPEPTEVLVIRVNGKCWRYPVEMPKNKWIYLGIAYRGGTSTSSMYNVAIDGVEVEQPRAYYHDGSTDGEPVFPSDALVEIGRGMKAKFDQVVLPRSGSSIPDMASHMKTGLPMVTLTQQVTSSILQNVGAYYEFDDPETPGFDLYSQDNWLRIMQSAFDGYRGAKFYLSVKTPQGYSDANLPSLINNAAWREQFATDLAELSIPYDGVELDLEWVYNWSSYGLLAQKIREKLPEGKIFRVSTHNVTYGFPKDKMQYVDGFTFQQYGPQSVHFVYSKFENYCRAFENYGYEPGKIMTSYSTTTSNGSGGSPIKGVKDGFFDGDYTPQLESESKVFGNETYYFTGPLQTYARAKFTRERNYMGIFYWDMGNDVYDPADASGHREMSKWNLARWCSYAINANVDRLVTKVDVRHADSGIAAPMVADTQTRLSVVADGTTLRLCVPGKVLTDVVVFNAAGAEMHRAALNDGAADVAGLAGGFYLLTATAADGTTYSAKYIQK